VDIYKVFIRDIRAIRGSFWRSVYHAFSFKFWFPSKPGLSSLRTAMAAPMIRRASSSRFMEGNWTTDFTDFTD